MREFDCIIIGSGAGGLSAALCLARAGKKVIVLEQHYVPGGWCHSFYIGGQRFSPGLHYIGSVDEGEGADKLYKGLGIANDLVFFRMNPKGYEHCWIGNERIDIPAGPENVYKALSARFPHEKKGLRKYLQLVQNVSSQIQEITKIRTLWDKITMVYRTRHLGKFGLFSLKKVIGWHIKDPLLQKVLNIQCGDHGLSPAKASFPFHCALMAHYLNGGFYPMGGGAAIVKSLTRHIKKNGGEIITGQAVKRVLVDLDAKGKASIATGVEMVNGDIIRAKHVISNADPGATYKMVGHEYLNKKTVSKLLKTKYSVSSLMFFVTVDMDLQSHGLDSGNIWLIPDKDMDDVYDELGRMDILAMEELKSMFINFSTLKDPVSYNGREHVIEIITFIDYHAFRSKLEKSGNYEAAYRKCKDHLKVILVKSLEKIIPGITENILQVEIGTPTTNEYYVNSTQGCVYGTEKGFWQTGPFAFPNKTSIENLYMCGASTISHGVIGSSYSGVKVAATILGSTENDILKQPEDQHLRIYDADDSTNWPEWLKQKSIERKRREQSRA